MEGGPPWDTSGLGALEGYKVGEDHHTRGTQIQKTQVRSCLHLLPLVSRDACCLGILENNNQ